MTKIEVSGSIPLLAQCCIHDGANFLTHCLVLVHPDMTLKSEYDQVMPQSQTADQPMAPQGRDTEHRQPYYNRPLSHCYLRSNRSSIEKIDKVIFANVGTDCLLVT